MEFPAFRMLSIALFVSLSCLIFDNSGCCLLSFQQTCTKLQEYGGKGRGVSLIALYQGGIVAQMLVLLLHNSRDLCSILSLWSFQIHFVTIWLYDLVLQFLPNSQKHTVKLFCCWKLPLRYLL